MENTDFDKAWKIYEPLIEALSELFHPFIEIAVHNLKTGKIVALFHNISQRKVGDPSPLKELKVDTENFPSYFPPYYKQNIDGRPLKCTSITMKNQKGHAIGLICFNVDVSIFEENYKMLEAFLKTKSASSHPIDMFGKESEAETLKMLDRYLQENSLSLKHLNRSHKKAVIWHLYQKGAFNFKNAIPLLAKKLSTSRATIYNILKRGSQ